LAQATDDLVAAARRHVPPRVTFAPEGSRGEVFLNLIFLLSIVMLPVTNGLYGVYRLDSVVAVSYGFHLTVIAGLNALLWILALRGRRPSVWYETQAGYIAAESFRFTLEVNQWWPPIKIHGQSCSAPYPYPNCRLHHGSTTRCCANKYAAVVSRRSVAGVSAASRECLQLCSW
jgi:hypothetical protein